jgi:hypothetical protein
MNHLIIAFLFFFSLENAYSTAFIEESLWIKNPDEETLKLLKSRPELTIDHLTPNGFELYGPMGLEKFLKQNSINFSPLQTLSLQSIGNYPTPEEIERELKNITQQYPNITKLYSIGKSVKKRDLWVMKLSRNAKIDDDRPEFKYVANMHGDEIVGRELLMRFIKECTSLYGIDSRLTNLLDKFQISILVSMNPDGAASGTRANAKKIDLNRDFPDFTTTDNIDKIDNRAPETQAVMKWQSEHHFQLSANFHGGSEVVNYPWDTSPNRFPEEDLVKSLSREYAKNAPYIAASTTFQNGITNGYAWYEVNGGMQDWSIYWRKDLQLTIELSNTKWPDYSAIDYYYNQNRLALIALIEKLELLKSEH